MKGMSETYWVTVLGGVRENNDESPAAKVEGKWKWSDSWLRCEGLGCCVEMNRRRL